MVYLDIEVDPLLTVRKAHALANNVEKAIIEGNESVYDVHVHVEPAGNVENENFGIDSAGQFEEKN